MKNQPLLGKTYIVTGAGLGIGKACALAISQAGGNVVVADLGASLAGIIDESEDSASQTVAEITKAGGSAIAMRADVSRANHVDELVGHAKSHFDGFHGIIHAAGILRDGMFHKSSAEDFEKVLAVHLNGAFHLAHASINHFRDQQEGSYVFFGSTSGLIGNIGQANYAAAKMGVAGLSRILAMEGARANVRANVIAPFAFTRMIASIPVKDEASAQRVERIRNAMRPDQVAIFAADLLASPDVTGQIFAVRGNEIMLFSQPRPVRSIARTDGWDLDAILTHGLPALKGGYTDLRPTAEVITWDPI